MHISAVDPNSLFWDPDPEMCPTLDHDPSIVTETPTVCRATLTQTILSRTTYSCRSALCRIQGNVVRHNVAFGIMLHSDLCRSGLCCSA